MFAARVRNACFPWVSWHRCTCVNDKTDVASVLSNCVCLKFQPNKHILRIPKHWWWRSMSTQYWSDQRMSKTHKQRYYLTAWPTLICKLFPTSLWKVTAKKLSPHEAWAEQPLKNWILEKWKSTKYTACLAYLITEFRSCVRPALRAMLWLTSWLSA